ncbi:hypothetical protein [Butyrivibrio sp. INlla14]|uniref:hypothetical protein n=1 Tax=Butyrivibrio sp. INlla14 TaxID=1520808 RepID=UPI0008772566|nr:hypothetical protein [Butyrivibrio sp. INlla14]SCY11319.1 hypothetical protein SAMN02910371_01112 [Butyrivibrio sp. INlla14]
MNNTINLNGMMSRYNSIIQSVTTKKTSRSETNATQNTDSGDKDTFVSTLKSKVEVAETMETQGTQAVSTKDMSLEEYKNYIHDQISSFPWHPDNLVDNYSIHISDEGFKAMQNDPDYEKYVLSELKKTFATPYPSWARSIRGSRYVNLQFGASKETSSFTSWSSEYDNGKGKNIWETKSEDSFWSKRGDASKVQARQGRKIAEKKALEKKWQQEAIEKRQT